jgi:polysaccharide export outer membrane protein
MKPIISLIVLSLNIVLAPLVIGQTRSPNSPATDQSGNLPIQKIGANDLVAVSVYDVPELTRTVRVSPDGYIRLPMLKQRIAADNLLPAELETSIAAALKQERLIVDPFVTVTVAEYTSRPISVMGAVRKPLTFQASNPVTLLEALARAEGLTPDAGAEILLTRSDHGQELVQRISVRVLIDNADPSVNVRLTGGEEIRVPEAGKLFVVGNVKKPGAFPFQDNQQTTVLKAIAMAEGLIPYAGHEAYILRREASGSKNEIHVSLKLILDRKAPDMALMANDVLYIPDAKGTRAMLSVVEKLVLYGSGVTSALIYSGVK